MMRKALMMLLGIAMVGCTTTDAQRSGPEVTVTPVRYQLQLTAADTQQANLKWQAFSQKYASELKGKTVKLTWYSHRGYRFIQKLPKDVGYSVTIVAELGGSNRFDVKAEFVASQVQLEPCQRDRMGHFSAEVGCFTENARWQSMVNPQNAL